MPITGSGWELLIQRHEVQHGAGQPRTVGSYQVFHDGNEVGELFGTTAEAVGPGSNHVEKLRILPGRYPLWTQNGTDYDTIGYVESEEIGDGPKPGIELKGTGSRREILIHPGKDAFLSSVGCINLCTSLPDASEVIDYPGSRRRVIALIEDARGYLGNRFPPSNGLRMPDCWVVIEGEP